MQIPEKLKNLHLFCAHTTWGAHEFKKKKEKKKVYCVHFIQNGWVWYIEICIAGFHFQSFLSPTKQKGLFYFRWLLSDDIAQMKLACLQMER